MNTERQSTEKEEPRINGIRILETKNDAEYFVSFLNHPANLRHFSNPPQTADEALRRAKTSGKRSFVANGFFEGQLVPVGGFTLMDAPLTRHDHFLEQVVVNPDLKGRGIGTRMIEEGIKFAATTLADDGRVRIKLCAGIIAEIEEWERMTAAVAKVGFEFVARFQNQVDVPVLDGYGNFVFDDCGKQVIEIKPVERWELDLIRWRENHSDV